MGGIYYRVLVNRDCGVQLLWSSKQQQSLMCPVGLPTVLGLLWGLAELIHIKRNYL